MVVLLIVQPLLPLCGFVALTFRSTALLRCFIFIMISSRGEVWFCYEFYSSGSIQLVTFYHCTSIDIDTDIFTGNDIDIGIDGDRGGSGIKYYELSEGDDKSSSLPQAHSCHEYKANGDPLSGVALLPAKSLDVANVEVARLLRLTTNTVQHGKRHLDAL